MILYNTLSDKLYCIVSNSHPDVILLGKLASAISSTLRAIRTIFFAKYAILFVLVLGGLCPRSIAGAKKATVSAKKPVKTPYYFNTIPKTGTYLLLKAHEGLTGLKCPIVDFNEDPMPHLLKGGRVMKHTPYTPENKRIVENAKAKMLFICRDPRDQLISSVFWIQEWIDKGDPTLQKMYGPLFAQKPSFSTVLQHVLRYGTLGFYKEYTPWMNEPYCCTVRFEDLVGPSGGGSLQNQLKALKKMADFLGVSVPHKKLVKIANQLYGGTWSFRSGKRGSWKKYFTPNDIKFFKEHAGDLLIRLGYEKNKAW